MRNILLAFLTFFVIVLSGCASHAPSAAQFMSVQNGKGRFVAGGTYQGGDIYTGDYIFDEDCSTNELRGFFDLSFFFGYNGFLFGVSTEDLSFLEILGYHNQHFGIQTWGGFAITDDANPLYGGLMFIEEFQVNSSFRYGFSEHLSRNGYAIDKNGGGLGSPSTAFYTEIGGGAYVAYEGFSLEFKYGREITDPKNRLYFMANYGF